MDITNQLQQIRVFLAQYGFKPVLKKMTLTAVTPIEIKGIAGEYPAHHRGNRRCPGAEQEVAMIPKQRPGITRSPAFHEVFSQALQKIVPVPIIPEYGSALYASGNDVMKCPWGIDP